MKILRTWLIGMAVPAVPTALAHFGLHIILTAFFIAWSVWSLFIALALASQNKQHDESGSTGQ